MRIAFIGQKGIGPGTPPGGVEMYVEELAGRLAKAGESVTVFCRSATLAGTASARPRAKTYKGVRLVYVPTLQGKLFSAVTSSFFAALRVRGGRFDVVHFQGIGPGFFTFLVRLLAPRTRVVVTFHSRDYEHTKWPWFGRAFFHVGEWVSITSAHAVVVVARHLQDYARRRYRRTIAYIPQGVALPPQPPRFNLGDFGLERERYVLAVSRLEPHKGLELLLKAYGMLAPQFRRVYKLAIVGAVADPQYEKTLKAKAREAGEGVLLLGSQPHATVAGLMRKAYLFVQPSTSEGLSIALLEAIAAGRPALVSAIAANTEVVTEPDWQFASGSAQALAAKLTEHFNAPTGAARAFRVMGARVRREHSWPNVFKQYQKLYRELLTKNS